MKKLTILAASLLGLLSLVTSCNDEWKDEQYTQYVSFRAPLNDAGVTEIYVPYTRHNADGTVMSGEGKSYYDLPVIVSGSTNNAKDLTVHFSYDPDTLSVLNYARFSNRTDLFYHDMTNYATFAPTIDIPKGTDVGLLRLNFDFKAHEGTNASVGDIDMAEKWVLPVQILDDASYNYTSHPRKNYAKAMLRIFPFNDFSGDYSSSALKIFIPGDEANASTVSEKRCYVVNENTVFFYAGNRDEDYTDRRNYKIYARFIGDTSGTLELYTDNPNMKLNVKKEASFRVVESMDAQQPYLKHRYVIINNLNYSYVDYTSIKNYEMPYEVSGSMTLERKINTQIPDEDQAIEW